MVRFLKKGLSVGVDLAGVESRNTGVASLDMFLQLESAVLHGDDEILEYVLGKDPEVILIDAPLSLPNGRKSLERRSNIHFRECDLELRRRHIPFFPITLGPMRKLTSRGIRLARILRSKGSAVFEGYPGAAQDLLSFPRKGVSKDLLGAGLRNMGLHIENEATHDELDAVTIAYVGLLHLNGKSELIGNVEEGQIMLPLGSENKV